MEHIFDCKYCGRPNKIAEDRSTRRSKTVQCAFCKYPNPKREPLTTNWIADPKGYLVVWDLFVKSNSFCHLTVKNMRNLNLTCKESQLARMKAVLMSRMSIIETLNRVTEARHRYKVAFKELNAARKDSFLHLYTIIRSLIFDHCMYLIKRALAIFHRPSYKQAVRILY